MTNRISGLRAAFGVATLSTLFAAQVHAQGTTFDARWQAWLGCWQPSAAVSVGAKPSGVCVSPIDATSAVEVAVIQDGAVASRDTIDASGVERHVDKQGCVGTEAGRWSADNRRVFLHSVLTCAGGLSRTGNGIVAMTPSGDWVNVQSLTVGNNTGVRAVHYRDANSLNMAPADIATAIGNRQLAINAGRAEAGTALDIRAVLEAVKLTDTAAVQSWIVERGTKFNLDAKQVVALADAGVPSSITDVMIGVSYPEHFALKPATPGAGMSDLIPVGQAGMYADRANCSRLASAYDRTACERCRDSWGYDPLFGSDCGLGYRYGYSPYGYGYGYGYGYPYAYGLGSPYYPYYGYSTAPVVIVKGQDEPHGRVVNGRGYSQHPSGGSSGSGGGASTSSGGFSTGGGGASTSATGSSSSGSSSSGGGGGGGETRTAHPRPPM